MGLLSTDLVYYESRSAYVVLSPDSAAQVEDGYQQMERALRERDRRGRRRRRGAPQPRRSPARPELGDAVRRGRRRADHRRDDAGAGRALPRRLRAPLRQPLPLCAGPGRHLPRPARRPGRQDRVPRARRRSPGRSSARRAPSSCATSTAAPLQAGLYQREDLPVGAVVDRPGDHPRGPVHHRRHGRPGRRDRPLRRDRHRAGAHDPRPRRRPGSQSATAATASPRPCSPTASTTSSSTCAAAC